MKKQTVLSVFLAVVCSAVIFAAFILIFLKEPASSVKGNTESVPYGNYYDSESCGFLVRFRDGNSVFLNFDFEDSKTSVLLLPNGTDSDAVSTYGYTVYKTIDTDYTFLARFTDRLGGIELSENGKSYKYTGVQVKEKLSSSIDKALRRQIIKQFLGCFNSQGLTKEDLVFIIENTETELNFPDAYNLAPAISDVSKTINFIN